MTFSKVKGQDKLLVPKLDLLIKHYGRRIALGTMMVIE